MLDPSILRRSWLRPRGAAFLLAATLVATLLAACGGGPGPSIGIGLSTAVVEVVRGSSQQITVTLSRQGDASGSVDLALEGTLPSGVSAVFAPPTLGGGATQSLLTISVEAGAEDGSTALTVVASSGDLEDSAPLTLAVVSLEVSGQLLGLLGQPLAGVAVSSQGQATVTAGDGTFELSGLSLPYDLATASAAAYDDGALHVFAGLEASEPVLMPFFGIDLLPGSSGSATVSGDVFGGAPLPAKELVVVCIEGLGFGRTALGCDMVHSGNSGYGIFSSWWGAGDLDARIHAFRVAYGDDDEITDYIGYAVHDLSVSDGGSHTVDLVYQAIDSGMLSVTRTSESGLPIQPAQFLVRVGPNLLMQIGKWNGPATVAMLMPVAPGWSYGTFANDGGSVAWRVGLEIGDVDISIPAPLTLVTPIDAAGDVDLGTVFTIAGPAGQAKTYAWLPAGPSGARLFLTTTQNSASIPDPAPHGLSLAAGAAHSWGVIGHGTVGMGPDTLRGGYPASIDATYNDWLGGAGPYASGAATISSSRDFSTAP